MPSEHGHRRWRMGFGDGCGAIMDFIKDLANGLFSTCTVYVKGRHLSYQRSKRAVNPNTSLIKIDGVDSTEAANFYLGKKVAFVYRAKREVRGSNIRVIWGKVTRPHGNSGVVRAQFRHNLPPKSFGATVRVMLYPSNI
ncbi:60S ribosomal protein L33-B [Aspergillus lentulus]|uniref:60S ribosomal protein L33-B n=1 Tax=Aspergillus lentulus TaxID=293939 RepID=A0AAN4PDK9_ASPLE|nr:hypothetical protein CNMCM6069_002139 [Aspergillus lentulus]KAF4160994.1 hypothetical protein CNMCM6936_003731 [Aspergillus lentulus]KAF4171127.1 hypothetical protein CNMCM8060_003664 [Aspergillus lentulus]KAF4186046.1 hypothetical protein CNMCM7927_005958 [Aspergillus lentulus]KAF4196336.1 hypothetical protein CNMCM8694_005248 [Aspergillus lentulus]